MKSAWPISCLNDSETQERGLQGVKLQKNFPMVHALGSPWKLGNRSVLILDPRLFDMKDCWKHWLKSYLACMNDCSDPKRNDNFLDSTKVFMPYFDQVYVKTCFGQVWKIVKCKLLEVFLLVTCKSVSLNWRIERSHVLLLFYLSCKLKRVGRLHDVKQLFWKPANDENYVNFLWDTS